MGFGRRPRIPLWVVILVICCIQQKASSAEDVPERVTILPPLQTMPVISSFHSAHNGRVCSTWGTFHYKTFDGDIYNFPGVCKYVFASHCNAPFEDFNIQLRHQRVGNTFTISYVTVKLDGTDFKIEKDQILVNGKRFKYRKGCTEAILRVHLPYNGPGFEIEHFFNYIKVDSKMGLTLMWNKDDSVMGILARGTISMQISIMTLFFEDTPITDFQFGNQWKKNDPTEDCEDPIPPSQKNCIDEYDICRKTLTGSAFSECNDIVGVKSYIDACVHDLCLCDEVEKSSCLCDTFSEYSRQCAHAGGRPQQWRSAELCPITCNLGMQYQECGSPCANTCTNSERSHVCEDHCIDGCFCPPGTVFDDINGKSCIPFDQCSCIYNGESYAPGMTYSAPCSSCVCSGGEWNCTELSCPGICSIEGGSHISTYDEVWYNFHGKCNYIFTKATSLKSVCCVNIFFLVSLLQICDEETFTVLGDLGPCGLTEFESCLKMVALTINGGETFAAINRKGKVIVNGMSAQLPISVANVTIFQPSNSFIVLETNFGLQIVIQIIPLLQINIYLDPSFQGRMCGLCGNFNHNQRDDFKTLNGLIEGTATAFANTWKTQAACDNIKQDFNDPCTQSIENEKYARHWCGLLTDPEGPFAKCHLIVNPKAYHTNCMFDACACEKSENCMCAALSSYVRACRTKGIELAGWRTSACSKYTTSCARSLNYSYEISSCEPTCRSLSEPDITCHIKFVPVDGCTCENGTYMDDSGICVPANKCPCYYKGIAMLPGEVYHEFGVACTCNQGKLNCYGDGDSKQDCTAPMVYFDCRNATTDSKGAGCQKSCQTLDTHCYSPQCVSGCICPHGLVSDGKGSCIPVEECPCIHNDATYQPGEKIKVDCNTCICQNRMWKCTMETCLSTCAIYGDGHYITFDDKRYIFNGQCEYTLLQDYCGQNSSTQGSFRIISENIPCGTTGTTCSKSIKVFFKNYELILTEEQYKVVKRESGGHIPYRIHQMGIYLMIEIQKGLIALWDKRTTVFIKLSAEFKGEVCGLCGNYDGNGVNDFTTRSRSVVGDVLEFGNSWKVSPTCPDAKCVKDPCSKNPYRKAWSQKKCSIINSEVFAACHSQVEPTKYYEACVTDACACDTGGDCECFCTAVAAYAKVCSDHGVCVSWRTPSICPMFCDYYNNEGECEWHYKPCGAPCMKTCRNPSGRCAYHLPGLEGCYPHCPADKPYFSEDEMKCVSICGCYDNKGNYHRLGKTFTTGEMCQSCKCTSEGIISCEYDTKACYCYYEGKRYNYKEVIYNTTDGLGSCITAICDINGTINREIYKCAGITTKPPFQFTTSSATESIPTRTTMCVHKVCRWMGWYDLSYPSYEITNGEYETPEIIRAKGHNLCKLPDKVECRAKELPNETLHSLNQNVTCTPTDGLICNNKDQTPPMCYNFEVRFSCCNFEPCGPLTSTSATKTTAETTPVTETKTSLPYIPQSSTPLVIGTTRPTSQPSTLSSIQPTSTSCQPKCQWTQWFDDHNPNTSPDGDFERFEDIRARGLVCEHPKDIKCQAKDYAHTRNPAPAQNFQCNLEVGLVCEHEKQKQKPYKCVNYQVQFLCCDYSHCQTVTTAVTTGKQTTTTLPTPPSTRPVTSGIISTALTTSPSTPLVSTSTAVTTGKQTTTTTSTPLSKLVSTSAEVTTGKQTTTAVPTPPSTRLVTSGIISTVPIITQRTTSLSTNAEVTTRKQITTTLSTPLSTLVSTTSMPITTTTAETMPSTQTKTSPSQSSTPLVIVTTHPTSQPSTPSSIQSTSKSCQPKCQWTQWFDDHNPNTSPDGDFERFEDIRAHGLVCEHPKDIKCQAKDYAHTKNPAPMQNFQCNLEVGLVCEHKKQKQKPYKCVNYQVQFLCCDYSHCQTVTTAVTAKPTSAKILYSSTTSSASTLPHTILTTSPSTPPVSTSTAVTTGKQTTTTLPTPPSTRLVTSGIISTASTTSPSTPLVSTSTAVTTGKQTTTTISTPLSTLVSTSAEVTTGKQTTTTLPTPQSTRLVTSGIISTASTTSPSTPLVSTSTAVITGKQTTTTLPTPPSTRPITSGIISTALTTSPSTPLVSTSTAVTTGKQTTTALPTPSSTRLVTSGIISTAPIVTQRTTSLSTNAEVTTRKQITTTLSTPLSTLVSTTSMPITTTTAETMPSTQTNTSPPQSNTPLVIVMTRPTSQPSTQSSIQPTSKSCQPKCQWTQWFDDHNPNTSPDGDFERFEDIRARGLVCEHPKDIKCQAKDYAHTRNPAPAQNFQCNLEVGLVCEHEKQKQKPYKCVNYQVQFLCCDYSHCQTVTTAVTAKPTSAKILYSSTTSSASTLPHTILTTSPSTPPVSTSTAVTTGKQTTTTLPAPPSTRPVTSGIISTASTTSPSTPLVSTSTAVTTGKQTTTTLPTPPSTRPVTSGIISTASTTSPSTPLVSTSTAVTTGKQKTTTLPTPPSTRLVTSGIISTTSTTSPSTPLVSTSAEVTTGKQTTTTLPAPPSTRPITSGIISTASTTSPSTPLVPTSTAVTTGKQTTTTFSIPLSTPVSTTARITTGKQITTALPTPPSTRLVTSGIVSTASTTSPSTPLVSTSTAVTTGKQTTTIISTPLSTLVSTSAEVTTGKQTTTTLPAPPSTRPITSGIISTASTTSPSTPLVPTSTAVTTGKQTTTTFSIPLSTLVSTTARITTGKQTTTALPTPPSTRLVTSGIVSTASTTSPSTPLVSISTTVTKGKQTTTTLPAPPSTRPITSGIMSTLSTTSPSTHLVSTSTAVTTGKQTTTILSPPLSTLVSTSAGLSTGSTLATTLSRVTPCFCHVSGTPDSLFSPGEVIYNTTDHSGCRFIAICNANCEIKRNPVLCPTTTPHPSVTTSGRLPIPTSTTFTPATELHTSPTPRTGENIFSTPVPDCPDADPPRKFNETWMFNNCTKATCEGSNRIVVVPLRQAEKIVCASGLEPKKIVDKDGCIERYECECICKGWDHYNFMTFDGTSYTFHGNCTYILVKEIVNKYGNLRILLDNAFCDIAVNQSCSRSLIIYYNSMEVRLTSEMHEGVRVNEIFFGNDSVPEGFVKDGIVATSTGVTMMIEMPAISGFVSFNGFTFFIMLSHELFQHNTEGQCGSCSNDQSDDCRKPNGQKADSCSEMAIYWQVPDINKPDCQVEPTTPPIVSTIVPTTPVESTPTPTPTPCSFPSPLCQLIISDIFAECHKVLSPRQFYDDCLTETCQASNDSSSCIYIDMYASLCTANGACADWRSKTHGKCPYYCAKDKVYAPCAPIHPETCENGVTHENNDHVAERCICPEGTILFNSHTGLCVPECGCVGPDGLPKLPGMTVPGKSCETCICSSVRDPATKRNIVECKPVTCNTDCPMGHEYQVKPGECCGNCIQVACIVTINAPNCKPYKNQTLIRENECVSSETVELTHCEGTCPSSSILETKLKVTLIHLDILETRAPSNLPVDSIGLF
ncbi:hypothetical protein Chor_016361 [Crotalus horridus]